MAELGPWEGGVRFEIRGPDVDDVRVVGGHRRVHCAIDRRLEVGIVERKVPTSG